MARKKPSAGYSDAYQTHTGHILEKKDNIINKYICVWFVPLHCTARLATDRRNIKRLETVWQYQKSSQRSKAHTNHIATNWDQRIESALDQSIYVSSKHNQTKPTDQ